MEGILEKKVNDSNNSEIYYGVGLAANQDRAKHPHQLGLRTTPNASSQLNQINDKM